MRKGLRGFVDDALSRTRPLAVEKSGDFPTARPFAHKLHRALFGSDKLTEGQNQAQLRSPDHHRQGSTYQSRFSVQTNGATSVAMVTAKVGQGVRVDLHTTPDPPVCILRLRQPGDGSGTADTFQRRVKPQGIQYFRGDRSQERPAGVGGVEIRRGFPDETRRGRGQPTPQKASAEGRNPHAGRRRQRITDAMHALM